jgi:hypothetical protein
LTTTRIVAIGQLLGIYGAVAFGGPAILGSLEESFRGFPSLFFSGFGFVVIIFSTY